MVPFVSFTVRIFTVRYVMYTVKSKWVNMYVLVLQFINLCRGKTKHNSSFELWGSFVWLLKTSKGIKITVLLRIVKPWPQTLIPKTPKAKP